MITFFDLNLLIVADEVQAGVPFSFSETGERVFYSGEGKSIFVSDVITFAIIDAKAPGPKLLSN